MTETITSMQRKFALRSFSIGFMVTSRSRSLEAIIVVDKNAPGDRLACGARINSFHARRTVSSRQLAKMSGGKNNGIWPDSTRWANLARKVCWVLYDRILRSNEHRRSVRVWSPSGQMQFFWRVRKYRNSSKVLSPTTPIDLNCSESDAADSLVGVKLSSSKIINARIVGSADPGSMPSF